MDGETGGLSPAFSLLSFSSAASRGVLEKEPDEGWREGPKADGRFSVAGLRWKGKRGSGALPHGSAFSGESGEKSTRGCGPWTPGVRGGDSSPHTPLLWFVETGRGVFFRLSAACGPHSARPQGEPPTDWAAGSDRAYPLGANVGAERQMSKWHGCFHICFSAIFLVISMSSLPSSP